MIYVEKQSKLTIVTNDNKKVEEAVVSVVTESDEGKIEILPNHTKSIISTIPTVTTFISSDGKEKNLFTSSGIIYIDNNSIKFCCDSINWPQEIDLDRAKLAEERAKKRLSEKGNTDTERAKNALLRAKARIEIKKNI